VWRFKKVEPTEEIVPLDSDITPAADVSDAVVFASDDNTFLKFNALRQMPDGTFEQAGYAIVRFEHCLIHKFGYPNDEAYFSIPRTKKLGYRCFEVINGEWNRELAKLNSYAFPSYKWPEYRHFLFQFHDSSFECLAKGFTIELADLDSMKEEAAKMFNTYGWLDEESSPDE
jgi:hypothetical protein